MIGPFHFFERRKRDLNPRAGFPTYTLSRGASSASWVFLQVCLNDKSTNYCCQIYTVFFAAIPFLSQAHKLLYLSPSVLSTRFFLFFIALKWKVRFHSEGGKVENSLSHFSSWIYSYTFPRYRVPCTLPPQVHQKAGCFKRQQPWMSFFPCSSGLRPCCPFAPDQGVWLCATYPVLRFCWLVPRQQKPVSRPTEGSFWLMACTRHVYSGSLSLSGK